MRNLLKKRRYGSRGQVGYSVLNQVYDNVRANLKGLAAVLKGTLLDLSSNLGGYSKWVFDRSFKSNHATLKTGIYAIANGASDSLINADCSVLGSAYYRLRASIRSSSNGSKVAQVASTAAGEVAFTVTNAGVWEEVVSTPTASAVVPSLVRVGQANPGAPVYSNLDCSDVRLERSTNGVDGWTEVSRWQLNDSEAASLDGHFVADVSGNGYHGAHVGGSSGSGEGMDPVLAKLDGGLLWYNGTDTSLDYGSPLFPATADFDETFWIYVGYTAAPSEYDYAMFQPANSLITPFGIGIASTTGYLTLVANGGVSIADTTTRYNELVKVRITRISGVFELFLNDVSIGTDNTLTGYSIPQSGNTAWGDAPPHGGVRHWKGLVYGDNVSGTQSGSFITLATKRATILQTAGLNWNKQYWFDGTDDYLSKATPPEIASKTVKFRFLYANSNELQLFQVGNGASYSMSATINSGGTSGVLSVASDNSSDARSGTVYRATGLSPYLVYTVEVTINGSYQLTGGTINGNALTTAGTEVGRNKNGVTEITLGARSDALFAEPGLFYGFEIDGVEQTGFTVNGSPDQHLIPQLASDPSLDATGQPIDNPRPNGKVVNLASGNLSAQVAADASMDATQTVYGWVYYDGTDGNFFDLGAPTIGATSGALTATNFSGALTYYVNGVATSTLGAAGWKLIGIASNAPQGTDAIDLLRTCAALRFSERELTAAEIADIYNAEKSQYAI